MKRLYNKREKKFDIGAVIMESGQYIRTLAEFVTGEIELPKFRQIVEDRLFGLLKKPEMTDEKRFLSSIELYLHEAEEKLRDESEVYAHVQFILDDIILARLTSIPAYFSPSSPKLPYLLSKISQNKQKTIIKDLSLTASK